MLCPIGYQPFVSRADMCVQQVCNLLDHLVGELLKLPRHVEPERLGGLHVDHQVELNRCLYRELARLGAPEDAIRISRRSSKWIEPVVSVGQQAAEFSEETERIDGRKAVAGSQQRDLLTMRGRESIGHHDEPTIRLACMRGNDRLKLRRGMNRCGDRVYCKGRSGGFERGQVKPGVRRRCRVEKEGNPGNARCNLFEQLQPFAGNRRFCIGEAGNIAAWLVSCTASENTAPVPFESAYAIWTSWQHSCDRDDQALMQRGDRVGNVTLGPDRRGRRGG